MSYIIRILKSAGELWRYYVAISIFTILVSLMSLLQPLLSGWAIDEIGKGALANVRYVAILAFLIFLTDIFSNLFSNIGGFLGDRMSFKLSRLLSMRYYEHLLTLPQRYFDIELSGKIINRLNRSITQISNFMHMMSNNFLQFIFSTVFALVVVAYYSWPVALMLMALYPVYIWMTFKTSGRWQAYQEKINKNHDIATGRFTEVIGQIKVVKSYIQEKRELLFFKKRQDKIVDIARPQSKLWHAKDMQRRLVLNFIFLGVYMYIFVGAANGVYTPGQAVALILYSMQIRIPIFTISFLVENTQRAVADSKDYFEILNVKPEIKDRPGVKELVVKQGKVEFKNVRFAYGEQEILKGMSFKITPGSKVALVGESGEGKTTITNLLLRLYAPKSGVISIDEQDVTDVTQQSLRQNIAVVFQDPALFSGTVFENISYAKPDANKQQVINASKAANAHEFISRFDNGYDTQIGERGLKLSGGQKQRIAIARALLKDAPILVLDEATSSLDSKSEAMVQEALRHLMKGRTTLIIAHRLSTIMHVDQIVTLLGGQVNESGSPYKLAGSGGIYSQLLKLQHGHTETNKEKLKRYDIATEA